MLTIEVKNLSKTYEYYKKEAGLWASIKSLFKREKLYTQAVKGICFFLKEGELVGFIGPNGAGKTTTLKMLSGILYPSAGQAQVLGFIPWQRKKEYQKQFALVMGQKTQLWWDLPAMETFVLNKEIYEIPQEVFDSNLKELTKLLSLKNLTNIPVRKLSLGERMKCELVAALLHNPKVLFLDEPTIGLDVVSQQNMWEFIKKYNQIKKTTIILTSHYMEDVERLCPRVIVIDKGKIIYDGETNSLIKKYVEHKILKISFTNGIKKENFAQFGEIIEMPTDKIITLKVRQEEAPKIASQILNSFPVDDILINEPDLEEVVRRIFTRL